MHTSSIRNNAIHNVALIKLIVARFVGSGSFLITNYIDILTLIQVNISPIKEVRRLFFQNITLLI